MQFIVGGPDIPNELLQAHEEGRVVFFCGAGISYPAGLPLFKELVEQIYKRVGETRSTIEDGAFNREQFDTTLVLLEQRLPNGRQKVREALHGALQPKRKKGATDTHKALLKLARTRNGQLRLVTTNFDRLFCKAAKKSKQLLPAFEAPLLPIPKDSRWDGLVYLHGLLPTNPDEVALNRLVVTSGDFGLAYLTERWAARFVSELFRNYVVCFVGYSINDPVLRYMMDALAADRMLGEITPQAWAFGDCESGKDHKEIIEAWEAKGVRPILYQRPAGKQDHSALHQTLNVWADIYRDGVSGKEHIVTTLARTHPSKSTKQDDFVGRMLWALSDKSGLPAKHFSSLNPVPPLDWLDELVSERYQHCDLPRIGVSPHNRVDEKLRFSLINRPVSYDKAPFMRLVSSGVVDSQWDDVMFYLAKWLLRHLDDPELILWVAKQGGQLNSRWSWLIGSELDDFASKEREGKTAELDEIRAHAPKAIPSPTMRTLWRLLLGGKVKSPRQYSDFYSWKNRLKHEGLTTTLRLELREFLAPKVVLKKPFKWRDDSGDSAPQVDCELELAIDHAYSALNDRASDEWTAALPHLLEDFQQLLRDALDLLRELGRADDFTDSSHWHLPSITPHSQNRGFRDWVSLIELLRDAWLAVRANNSTRASYIAQTWFDLPYPTFKRLALFAANHDDCISAAQWVDWLLADDARWLWVSNTKREKFQLLTLQGKRLTGDTQKRLEDAILVGPPREMYWDALEANQWQSMLEHSVWLHLAKLRESGLALGESATARLTELSNANPAWQLATDGRDEFSSWMSGTGDPDFKNNREVDIAPRKRHELVEWLKKPAREWRPFHEDTWRDVCRRHMLNSLYALKDLAHTNVWPESRWREALQTWSEIALVRRSWQYAAAVVQTMPGPVLQPIVHSLTSWISEASDKVNQREDILLNLCRRVMALPLDADTGITSNGKVLDEPVFHALNHPVGHVTKVLIDCWFRRSPNDNDLLPSDIGPLFTELCDTRIERFRHGRVLLASQLIALFRVDRKWTEQHLLPLFNWGADEANALWQGFLRSFRLHPPLFNSLKMQFLACANHYDQLGVYREQYASFLTFVALESCEGYAPEDFRTAFGVLPPEGLAVCVEAWCDALEGAGEQREEYWKNRVEPFWQYVWPKSNNRVNQQIAKGLVRVIMAAGAKFPDAFQLLKDWLIPVDQLFYIFDPLLESGMCKRFPREALGLLAKIINDQPLDSTALKQCLDEIVQSAPEVENTPDYQRLHEYWRRKSV